MSTSLRRFLSSSVCCNCFFLFWDSRFTPASLASYHGHQTSIKDMWMTSNAKQFVTSSFDRFSRWWDVETGKCLRKYTSNTPINVVRIHPEEEHIFLTGQTNKKIILVLGGEGRFSYLFAYLRNCVTETSFFYFLLLEIDRLVVPGADQDVDQKGQGHT